MDQVNAFLKVAKRHHFWVLTALLVVAGLGTWFYSTGQLRAAFEEYKGEIETTRSQIDLISREENHPNDSSKEAMKNRINDFAEEVSAVWKTLYENQEKNTLVWPTELEKDFTDKVEKMRPIEVALDYPTPPNQEIASNLTERYSDYIKAELPKLAETIGSKWQPSASGGGGSGFGEAGRLGMLSGEGSGTLGAEPEKELLVNWNPQNQSQIQQERFDWPTVPPTTLQVLYAQEDLWVLQTIMDIIAKTNGDATAHHRATIKEIESIHMGNNAVGRAGKVQRLKSRLTGEDDYFGGGGAVTEAEGVDPMQRYEAARGEGSGGQGAVDPAEYRYVDPENVPIAAATLRTALRENSPETAFLSVAKRLPVRIRVIMDQRKIPVLLAECGSAPLTIEVRQVRVNREAGTSSGGGGFGREYLGSGEGGRSGGQQTDVSTTYDIPVEIYGVVYIFNPPNDDILELSKNQKDAAVAAVNPAAPVAEATTQPAEPAEPVAEEPPAEQPAPVEPAPAPAAPAGEPPAEVPPPAEN